MQPKKWKFISRKTILEHPRLNLVEDKVELPDGTRVPYLRESPVTRHSVTIIVLNAENQILLQKEYSYPPDEIMWQLPGGTFDDSEDILSAANRELSEESGIIARKIKILGYYYTNSRRSDQKQYALLGTDLLMYKNSRDPEEFIENVWVTTAELKEKIRKGEIHNINLLAAMNMWLADKTQNVHP